MVVIALLLLLVGAGLPALALADSAATLDAHVEYTQSTATGLEVGFGEQLFEGLRDKSSVELLGFPLANGSNVDLTLTQTHLTGPETRIVAGTDRGDVPVQAPEILTFRGHVRGHPEQPAYLTVLADACAGLIQGDDELYVISREPAKQGAVTWVRAASSLPEPEPRDVCQVPPPAVSPAPVEWTGEKKAVFRVCRLALECDFEYWSAYNNWSDALTNIYTLFNVINAFYETDLEVRLVLPFIRIWTTSSDPYSYVGGDVTGLIEFENYWRANHNTPGTSGYVERDLAHLLSARGVGAWAEPGKLCDYNLGFSISGGNTSSIIHDVAFVAHELGHNFNAIHTHCFNPPLDNCVVGCNSPLQDCSTAPGTIMSYCDSCPGGLNNILHEFAPANIALIRGHIDTSCLTAAPGTVFVNWQNTSGTENGTVAWPFDTVLEGAQLVLPDGTLAIAPGSYGENITLWQSMIVTTYGGGNATIGQ